MDATVKKATQVFVLEKVKRGFFESFHPIPGQPLVLGEVAKLLSKIESLEMIPETRGKITYYRYKQLPDEVKNRPTDLVSYVVILQEDYVNTFELPRHYPPFSFEE